jgi:hypothetical protein
MLHQCHLAVFLRLTSSLISSLRMFELLLMVLQLAGKRYFIAYNLHSNRPGLHWVALVYGIKASSDYPLFVTPHLERTHDINAQIDFGAEADFYSSHYLPPLPLVGASSSYSAAINY